MFSTAHMPIEWGPEDPIKLKQRFGRNRKLERSVNNDWFTEPHSSTPATERPFALGRHVSSYATAFALAIGMCIFTALFIQAVHMTVVQGAQYRALADGNRLRQTILLAERGIIYDRNHTPLVKNVPAFALVAHLNMIAAHPEDIAPINEILAAYLDRETYVNVKTRLERTRSSHAREVVLGDLTQLEALGILAAKVPNDALTVTTHAERQYITDIIPSLSHIVGYTGLPTDDELAATDLPSAQEIGRAGIEAQYDDLLSGVNGVREEEVNARNQTLRAISQQAPQSGTDITLTIDVRLQKILEQSLTQQMRAAHSRAAAGIVMDPRNGEILAMVSLPTFNANIFSVDRSERTVDSVLMSTSRPLVNRAISGLYPSGSTIKPIIALGALADHIITASTTIESTGGIRVGTQFFSDWKVGGHGVTNVIKALAESVNTFFYALVGGYGSITGLPFDRLVYWLSDFGVGRSLGVDLPGEQSGVLPTPAWKMEHKHQSWVIGDTYQMGIGQGDILVTPLQVAHWMASIAQGRAHQPHILKDPQRAWNSAPLNAPVWAVDIVREGLRETVRSGSAKLLQVFPFAVSGKTGTAEIGDGRAHAWFVGYAPSNEPAIVIAVLIEAAGEGSTYAVPVAREVLSAWSTQTQSPT